MRMRNFNEDGTSGRFYVGSLQHSLELVFRRYKGEYGGHFDRNTFLDFVVATLFEPGDVKVLIGAYTGRLIELLKQFPELRNSNDVAQLLRNSERVAAGENDHC